MIGWQTLAVYLCPIKYKTNRGLDSHKNMIRKIMLVFLIGTTLIIPQSVLGAMEIGKLQDLGIKMIEKRDASIARYDGFLAKTKHISQPVLDQVRGELSRVTKELGELKTKIENETERETLKSLVKSIVTEYRVYQVFLPQSAGIVASDRLKAYQAKLTEVKDKINDKADELEKTGKDVTAIRQLLASAQEDISAGEKNITTAENKFTSMNISDPEGARTAKLDGRSALLAARQSFSEARKDLKEAVQEIKKLLQPGI